MEKENESVENEFTKSAAQKLIKSMTKLGFGKESTNVPSYQHDQIRKLAEQIEALKDDLEQIQMEPDGEKRELHRKKVLSDSYVAGPEDKQEDYETYLTQEPKGMTQKFNSYFSNQFEIWNILAVMLLAICMPSCISLAFMLLSCVFLHTSTYGQKLRLKLDFLGCILVQLLLIATVVWKDIKVDAMITSTRIWKDFKFEITFYECLGFKLNYENMTKEAGVLKLQDPEFQFKINCDFYQSFIFELALQVLLILNYGYIMNKTKIVNKLTNPDEQWQKDIEWYWNRVEEIQDKAEGPESDGEEQTLTIGTKTVLNKEDRQEEENRKGEIELRFQDIKRKLPINFVDSHHFYTWNSTFFILSLILTLFQAMVNNSASDIPSLFFILLMFATYLFRKQFTRQFLQYTFFVVYYLHFILILKLINEVMINIDFIHQWLLANDTNRAVVINNLLFGSVKTTEGNGQYDPRRILYIFNLLMSFKYLQSWKQTKWLEIRMKTKDLERKSYFYRFLAYLESRDNDNIKQAQMALKLLKESSITTMTQSEKEEYLRQIKKEEKLAAKTSKFDQGSHKIKVKARNDFSRNLPEIVLWTARVEMFILAYMYHSPLSLIHLIWLLLSFILSPYSITLISVYSMIPLLTWEFIFIYGSRIPVIKDTNIMVSYGTYLQFEMESKMTEQTFMYLTLVTFYMMISTFSILQKKEAGNQLLEFFKLRLKNPKYSDGWKIVFYSLRYIQSLVLFYLFLRGISNLQSLRNLAYMVFFTVYTAYVEIYRKTSKVLVLFISSIIFNQYLFSQFWDMFNDNDEKMHFFKWMDFYPQQNPQENPWMIQGIKDRYWRIKPNIGDWIVLFFMALLDSINIMFRNKQEIIKLQEHVANDFRDKYQKFHYYYKRVDKIFKGFLIYILLAINIYLHSFIQINMINWGFWILNILNLALMIRGTKSLNYISQILKVSNILKFYSLMILVIDITFSIVIGEREKTNFENSLDQKFKRSLPRIYEHLDIIGLRPDTSKMLNSDGTPVSVEKQMETRFMVYISFFMLSLYLSSYFKTQQVVMKADSSFVEEDFKKLFNYQMMKPDDEENNDFADKVDEELDGAIFRKKKVYYFQDLIDYYEKQRFTTAFMVYRALDWWPFFDILATYGHILSNGIIVIVATQYSINFFSTFNILCICLFYSLISERLHAKAVEILRRTGLQTQCDVMMAQLITKRYKNFAFYEIINLRLQVWNIQFIVLIAVLIIGFPSTLIGRLSEKLDTTSPDYAKWQIRYDDFNFWAFMSGVYMDDRKGNLKFIFFQFGGILLGLICERQAINWMKMRYGCTYFKLQKFTELDIRREALRKNWEIINPPYYGNENDQYIAHYYMNDYEEIGQRIGRNISETKTIDSLDEYGRKPIGDYVPHQIAVRMNATISFSVKIACLSPDLNIDEKSLDILRSGKPYEYESVPVFAKYKTDCLKKILKQNIDRKYKISFYKGMQLYLESIIQFLLMASVVMKGNVYSLIYTLLVLRLIRCRQKTELLIKVNRYLAIFFFTQYFLYMINLTATTSPAPYPPSFEGYPRGRDLKSIPWFFHYDAFTRVGGLRLGYLLGMGISREQVNNLLIDFLNLYILTMYISIYRNPVLLRVMTKVFWQLPRPSDREQWKRLDPLVREQTKWLFNPKPLQNINNEGYDQKSSNFPHSTLDKRQIQTANGNYEFALEYQEMSKISLNYQLTNYVDLKYDQIWSEEFLKQKKQEIKDNSPYYRIVKQGSQLVYVCFHVFTIFVVLLMATMRQSLISIGYVLILLPRMKDGSEVLDQRDIHQNKSKDNLQEEVNEMQERLKKCEEGVEPIEPEEKKLMLVILKEKQDELIALKKNTKGVNFQQRQEQKAKKANKAWIMLWVIEYLLMSFGLIDFVAQIIIQLPIFELHGGFTKIGLRKVWAYNPSVQSMNDVFQYDHMVYRYNTGGLDTGLKIQTLALKIQMLNCIIISIITLQTEIFKSAGYIKYVSQSGGSMDVLVQLADLKKKSITFVFNNRKIRKILSIQRRKEAIEQTVQRLRDKIIRWRKFTRTTLVNSEKSEKYSVEDHKQMLTEWARSENIMTKTMREEKEQEQKMLQEMQDNEENVSQDYGQSDDENQEKQSYPKLEKKGVKFDPEIAEKEAQDEDFDEIEADAKGVSISMEETQMIQATLCKEFVKAKLQKIRGLAKFYIWLNKTFTEQIMFKNDKKQLVAIVQQHAEGQVDIQTELERIMTIEAQDLIQQHYDHLEGKRELTVLLSRAKGKSDNSILQMTQFDRKKKLIDMHKSWDFTRTMPMLMKLVESSFYIGISQTQNFIYASMIFSMYQNAGIISVAYPIMVFGYAMLEETRPRKEFWNIVRVYTTIVMFFKFIMNLSYMEEMMEGDAFIYWTALLKIGIYDYPDLFDLTMYMAPEILIISFIMLNEIKLKLLGLFHEIEQDIETVTQGIERTIEKGDEEAVKQKRILSSNMCMARYFETMYEGKKIISEFISFKKQEIRDELELEFNVDPDQFQLTYGTTEISDEMVNVQFEGVKGETNLQDDQLRNIHDISQNILKTSRQFDVDANDDNSPFDFLVSSNCLQKSLETDNFIYIEGSRSKNQPEFVTAEEFADIKDLKENWDTISAGDCEIQLEKNLEIIQNRGQVKDGLFERTKYFEKIFPGLKIQKPGYDLYGTSTAILGITCIYVFTNFQHITVDSNIFKFMAGQTSIFNGDMAIVILCIIMVILIERYASRTDTKAKKPEKLSKKAPQDKGFFSSDEMFKKTSTMRSMTVQLKTMKTADLDMQGSAAQDFLSNLSGDSNEDLSAEGEQTKITSQQKTKFILHWVILVSSHLYIFWYLPIHGNYTLYQQPQCNEEKLKYYGCRNFHKDVYLRIFYGFILLYLTVSSIQISRGFPIYKKPSSVMQFYGPIPNLGSLVFQAIPFMVEVRCVLDFTMSKTSLDMFQYLQLWQYHAEIYNAMNGNEYYGIKKLGLAIDKVEKCLFGVVVSFLLLFLLIGPFVLFSEYGGLTQANPVLNGNIEMSFLIEKKVFGNATTQGLFVGLNSTMANMYQREIDSYNQAIMDHKDPGNKTIFQITQTRPYMFYSNKNTFLRKFDAERFEESQYSKWTETSHFDADQIQDCILNEFTDNQWQISNDNQQTLWKDIDKAVNTGLGNKIANVSLQIEYMFTRQYPSAATVASKKTMKTLNYSMDFDCQAGLELGNLAAGFCKIDKYGTGPGREKNGQWSSRNVDFVQAYIPEIVLGQSADFSFIEQEGVYSRDQMHDIRVVYTCDGESGSWKIYGSTEPSKIPIDDLPYHEVNPETCIHTRKRPQQVQLESMTDKNSKLYIDLEAQVKKLHEKSPRSWSQMTLTMFSVLVSSSLLAAYSPTTFYASVTYLAGGALRPILLFGTWKGWIYEVNNPNAIIKLIEKCYLARHEEDLVGEEEAYRMLQEIVRSPELFKAICGSCLKGPTDPILDKMTDEEKKKLDHFRQLEARGFDVEDLQEALLKGKKFNSETN